MAIIIIGLIIQAERSQREIITASLMSSPKQRKLMRDARDHNLAGWLAGLIVFSCNLIHFQLMITMLSSV